MPRKLFCEISPLTYQISRRKSILTRQIKDRLSKEHFATAKSNEKLSVVIYKHNSLIRRQLGNTRMDLQENKAQNLKICTPLVNGVLIKPGEVFSLWKLVGECTPKKGYKEGLMVGREEDAQSGIGGGMCQFSNLIHWMVLHTPFEIVEHHHHDGVDMFPDFGRKVSFGTDTSIVYNYLDYRFRNTTDKTYQLITYTDDEYLYGELRSTEHQDFKYRIKVEDEFFSKENGTVYRNSKIYKRTIDRASGNDVEKQLIKTNHAKVLYDTSNLEIIEM